MEQQKFVRKNTAIYDNQLRQERKRARRKVFYVFLLSFVSLVFLAVCVAVFLNVEEFKVNGSERYSAEQIIELVSIEKGDNIFSFKASEIEEDIKQNLPYVNSVEIKRDLPTTVEINIVEETPFYATNIAGSRYIISPYLKVLEKTDDKEAYSEITELSLNNVRRCLVGNQVEFVDSRTLDAVLTLYESFEANYIKEKIRSVDIRSRFDIYINYDNRFEVYLGDIENLDIKIQFLVGIIGELDENSKGTIDVSNHQEASVALT